MVSFYVGAGFIPDRLKDSNDHTGGACNIEISYQTPSQKRILK
jgi:hypothetical protein